MANWQSTWAIQIIKSHIDTANYWNSHVIK